MMENDMIPSGFSNLLSRLIPIADNMDLPRPQRNLVTNKKELIALLILWLIGKNNMKEISYRLIETPDEVPFSAFDC